MTDILDVAQKYQDRFNTESLANSVKPVPKLSPNGRCHHCDEIVNDIQLFCNAWCAGKYK